jgi:hypothetical protein
MPPVSLQLRKPENHITSSSSSGPNVEQLPMLIGSLFADGCKHTDTQAANAWNAMLSLATHNALTVSSSGCLPNPAATQ